MAKLRGDMPRDCSLRLQAIYNSLNKREKKIADLILKEPDVIPGYTIKKLAKESESSEATIVRFAKRLGYDGYLDMRRKFTAHYDERPPLQYNDMSIDDSVDSIISNVYKTTIQSLKDTFDFLDKDRVRDASRLLFNAKKVLICGVGDGAVTADAAYHKFMRVGIDCFTSTDLDMQLIYSSQMNHETDVVVIISHSGITRSLLQLVQEVKKRELAIIVITNYPKSPLANAADVVLQTYSFTPDLTGEVVTKRIAELFMIELIYLCTIKLMGQESLDTLCVSNNAVEPNKSEG